MKRQPTTFRDSNFAGISSNQSHFLGSDAAFMQRGWANGQSFDNTLAYAGWADIDCGKYLD